MRRTGLALMVVGCVVLAGTATPSPAQAQAPRRPGTFTLEETTVALIQTGLADGSLTCAQLTRGYLRRIALYEDAGPALNTLVTVAPDAQQQARDLDEAYRDGGPVGPLHCVPVVLKDNVDAADLPTTGGSLALAGDVPPRDATITRLLREAGALVLAKGNMDEWAHGGRSGYSSVNGQTKNPYDLAASPAGSSGGPAAAVAANFGVLSIGTDTLGSIRGPVNVNGLVGVKTTSGLVSGAGVIPFALTFDVAGPMTRTVADSAAMLDVVAGVDPEDPRTLATEGRVPDSYVDVLDDRALQGTRIGVLRTYAGSQPGFERALDDLEAQGAVLVDGIEAPAEVRGLQGRYYTFISETEFRNQLGEYLRTRRPGAPVQSHAEVLAASEQPGFPIAPQVLSRLRSEATRGPLDDPAYLTAVAEGPVAMRAGIDALLDEHDVEALVHAGGSGSALASLSGYPAVTVPAGLDERGVPYGLALLGTAFSEPTLLGLAHDYEQATLHRTPPAANTPPLRALPRVGRPIVGPGAGG